MKKKFVLVTAVLLCVLMLYGCGGPDAEPVDVEIGDAYYLATVRNILDNFDDYYGKTVRIEGVFWEHGTGTIYRMVMRKDFSC